jgi:hypothetical protein
MTLHMTGYKCTAAPNAYRIRTTHAEEDLDNLPDIVMHYMPYDDIKKLCDFIDASASEHTSIYFWTTND